MSDIKPLHSPIGASSMYRWATCPGSVAKCEGLPNKSSIYAQEGTAAHEIIGLALERALSAHTPTREILDDIFNAITLYSDYVESFKDESGTVIHIEHSFDMSKIFPMLYGTADCVVWHPHKKLLRVIDYKHGAGIPVDVKENKQLLYYALGAISTLGYKPASVEITIVQPRCYHPEGRIRSWEIPITYFIDFKQELIEAAIETNNPKAELKAGSHCQFCAAKMTCETKKDLSVKGAKSEFKFYTDPAKEFTKI